MQHEHRLTVYRKMVLWACLILFLLATSCRKRAEIEPTVGMDSPEQTWIRVLLFGNLRECTVASATGFVVEDDTNGFSADFRTDEPLGVLALQGKLLIGQHTFNHRVVIKPHDPYVFEINGRAYRGHLTLDMKEGNATFEVINRLPLESYLLGVIGAEMSSYWEPEALKTQTVAARTYCLYIKNRFGKKRHWDVKSSQANQVYRGVKSETPTIERAVVETCGQVLICRHPEGKELIFPTYYSSSCGGHTEDAENVFGETVESLGGVKCPYCKEVAKRKDFSWKPVTFTMDQINDKLMSRYGSLAKLERIVDFEFTRKGNLDRVTRVQLIGKNGKKDIVRGEDFRLALDSSGLKLRSAIFLVKRSGNRITFTGGQGFGHGVGLCQCGAQGMARKGFDYETILEFYFPDSKLITLENSIKQ